MTKKEAFTKLSSLSTDLVYYLAFPYTALSEYPKFVADGIKHHRASVGEQVASYLIKLGYMLIEPIGMSHHKAEKYNSHIKSGYEFWKTRDRKFVSLSDAVIVVNMWDWDKSVGVKDEIEYAKSLGKKVYLLSLPVGSFDFSGIATEDVFNVAQVMDEESGLLINEL